MCEFCKNLDEHKIYGIEVRTAYAKDNFCDVLRDNDCEPCNGCVNENFHFTLYTYKDMVQFGFIHEIPECTVAQTSEYIKINYCPWCGRKLTNDPVPFEKCCTEKMFSVKW